MTFLVLMFACIGCDRVTKEVAVSELQNEAPIVLAGGTLRLEYAENRGAFLGMASDFGPELRFLLLILGPALMLLAVAWLLLRQAPISRTQFAALTLILAGGIGNLVDRISAGYVVDFLNVGIGSFRTGIFNVADMAIMAGVITLILMGFVRREPMTGAA